MSLPAALILLACGAWVGGCVFGWYFGARGFLAVTLCARKNKCILRQRAKVAKWTKEITGGISVEMQERLAQREAARRALDE